MSSIDQLVDLRPKYRNGPADQVILVVDQLEMKCWTVSSITYRSVDLGLF